MENFLLFSKNSSQDDFVEKVEVKIVFSNDIVQGWPEYFAHGPNF